MLVSEVDILDVGRENDLPCTCMHAHVKYDWLARLSRHMIVSTINATLFIHTLQQIHFALNSSYSETTQCATCGAALHIASHHAIT